VFTGRIVGPGEPLFLVEDTDGAVALAEEEADTCRSCGMPRAWCRDSDNQFSFEVHEEQCHATYALAARRSAVADERDDAQRAAVQFAARFAASRRPDLMAGLDLPEDAAE
jgi:hypothetical protein